MKKKTQNTNNNSKRIREQNDLNSLDSQLGGFGLEPPKIYRNDQTKNSAPKKTSKASKKRVEQKIKNTKPQRQMSPDEKRKAQSKKRKQKKMLRRVISYIVLAVLIIAVLVVLSLTVLFKIDTIKIQGNEIYTNKEISTVLPIEKDDNLFISDTKGAELKLEENLPYIYNAEISRKFPSTIVVKINEADKIYASINSDKTYTLLDKDMKVLETNVARRPRESVVIKKLGVKKAVVGKKIELTDNKQLKDILALTGVVDSLSLEEITAVYSIDINNNYMIYDKRITYKLGSTENLEAKVYSALTATEKLNESDPDAQGEMTVSGDKQVYFTKK